MPKTPELPRALCTLSLTVALGLVACSGEEAAPYWVPAAPVEACYGQLQPFEAYRTHPPMPQVEVAYDAVNHRIHGEPMRSYLFWQRAKAATVGISSPLGRASGFVVEDPKGRQVIVTAAHVIGNVEMSEITVVNTYGQEARIKAGCYTYQRQGRLKNPHTAGRTSRPAYPDETVDVALLYPSRPMTRRPLLLADRSAQPGEWVYFSNHQGKDRQSEYIGLGLGGDRFLSGLQSWRYFTHSEPPETYSVEDGASGGPIMNGSAAVVGVVSTSSVGPVELDHLQETNGVTITGVPEASPGLSVRTGTMTPAAVIQQMLDAAASRY